MLHFVFQTALHLDAPYIAAAVLFWTGYLVYRLRAPEQARAWGLRSDTFAASLKANGVLLLIGGAAMVGFGLSHGRGAANIQRLIPAIRFGGSASEEEAGQRGIRRYALEDSSPRSRGGAIAARLSSTTFSFR